MQMEYSWFYDRNFFHCWYHFGYGTPYHENFCETHRTTEFASSENYPRYEVLIVHGILVFILATVVPEFFIHSFILFRLYHCCLFEICLIQAKTDNVARRKHPDWLCLLLVLKLFKVAKGVRSLLDTVIKSLPQVCITVFRFDSSI